MKTIRTSDQEMEKAIAYAVTVFSNKRKAMHWLSRPRAELHGQTPLDALQNPKPTRRLCACWVELITVFLPKSIITINTDKTIPFVLILDV